MKIQEKVSAIQTDYTTVQVVFEDGKPYVYKAKLGEVEVGDTAVVLTPKGLTCVKVVGVDKSPRVLDAKVKSEWIGPKVDIDSDNQVVEEEDRLAQVSKK